MATHRSITGTQTWDKTASGTLTRDFDVGNALERNRESGYTELFQYNTQHETGTETFSLNGSWSKNLATNVTTTIVNTASTTGGHESCRLGPAGQGLRIALCASSAPTQRTGWRSAKVELKLLVGAAEA